MQSFLNVHYIYYKVLHIIRFQNSFEINIIYRFQVVCTELSSLKNILLELPVYCKAVNLRCVINYSFPSSFHIEAVG